MKLLLEINYRPTYIISLNTRAHWTKLKRERELIQDIVYAQLRAVKMPIDTPITGVVDISITYPPSGLDIDNHGYVAKIIIDALRYYGLLADDNKRFVRSLKQCFGDVKHITVKVTPAA